MGDIISDLSTRRGRVQGMKTGAGNTRIINALVPLSEMFGYATSVRSSSQGRASYSMEPHCYEPVPQNIADEIARKSGVSV
jgi:elongation factor G